MFELTPAKRPDRVAKRKYSLRPEGPLSEFRDPKLPVCRRPQVGQTSWVYRRPLLAQRRQAPIRGFDSMQGLPTVRVSAGSPQAEIQSLGTCPVTPYSRPRSSSRRGRRKKPCRRSGGRLLQVTTRHSELVESAVAWDRDHMRSISPPRGKRLLARRGHRRQVQLCKRW
jgi:hypothetical protein